MISKRLNIHIYTLGDSLRNHLKFAEIQAWFEECMNAEDIIMEWFEQIQASRKTFLTSSYTDD